MTYKVAPDGTIITKRLEEINEKSCGQSIKESYKDYSKDLGQKENQ